MLIEDETGFFHDYAVFAFLKKAYSNCSQGKTIVISKHVGAINS